MLLALSGKNFGIGFDFKDVTLAYQIPLYILPFSLLSFVLYIKTSISSHEVNGPASCWLFRNSRSLILEISFCTLTILLTEYLFFCSIFIFQLQASSISFIMNACHWKFVKLFLVASTMSLLLLNTTPPNFKAEVPSFLKSCNFNLCFNDISSRNGLFLLKYILPVISRSVPERKYCNR